MQVEGETARRDPKNMFMMNQKRQQQIMFPIAEIKKRLPEEEIK